MKKIFFVLICVCIYGCGQTQKEKFPKIEYADFYKPGSFYTVLYKYRGGRFVDNLNEKHEPDKEFAPLYLLLE